MNPALPTGCPSGPVLVLVPHFDDEILGCAGLLAGLDDKSLVRVVFACDGRGSSEFPKPPAEKGRPDMADVRAEESMAALALLGIPWSAVRLLNFPDGSLSKQQPALREALGKIIDEVKPHWVLAPFRFDRHPDHIALSRVALDLPSVREGRVKLLEYFVYINWRLFPGGDIRRLVKPEHRVRLDLGERSILKRRALDLFTTQTTCYFPWQDRPVLTEELLETVSAGPELFLAAPAGASDSAVLVWPAWLVRLVLAIEPPLKRALYAWKLKRRLKRRKAHD